ncbi:MAG: NAD(P)-dependent oxidoreductase [Pedosphaera sp.]|nr:NAD(P)-dependent oxidoreductase [Pedosphaera sp.]
MIQLVLITGSSGRLGRAAVAGLQHAGHRVRGFDRVASPDFADTVLGDLGDRTALDRAMKGVDCLIHLAACPDDADFLVELLPANITGLYHVMESARAAGVRRIVLASSGQVNWWQQLRGPAPIKPEDPPSPRYWYAATKMFLESIGRGFSEIHGMSVIIARLGWCPRTLEQVAEIASSPWQQGLYLSPGDAGRFFACCVSARSDLRHAIVYAVSKPLGVVPFDLGSAKTLLGYEPMESWPTGSDPTHRG